jgi:hypothetical protein
LLRDAGVVTSTAVGKQRIYRLNPVALREVSSWADQCTKRWEARFDALGSHLNVMKTRKEQHRAR